MEPSQGDIYFVTLDPAIGSEMSKTRPGVIVSNNYANKYSSRVTVVPITSANVEKVLRFEVLIISNSSVGLTKNSKAACNQIRTIDKQRLMQRIGTVDNDTMELIKEKLRLHLDL